uniref:Glucagon / GIP / secretin / VIP family domain-containing protein n=1 Tax=Salmo trutta TaxID=8032 RepID=A0A673YCM3_SALTR
ATLNAYLSYLISMWRTYELQRGQNGINSFKRHSDGTFTNDYTHYLDKIKAKDFVQWLASTKREK